MVSEIILTKGAYSVTIYTNQVEDALTNKLFVIVPPTGSQNQDTGRKQNKIVDILKISRTFRIMGYIISNTNKNNLIKIFEGGELKGGGITMTYDAGGDSTSFIVYAESCIITQKAADEPTSPPDDFAKFDINLTLIQGTRVG